MANRDPQQSEERLGGTSSGRREGGDSERAAQHERDVIEHDTRSLDASRAHGIGSGASATGLAGDRAAGSSSGDAMRDAAAERGAITARNASASASVDADGRASDARGGFDR